jgi:hypothetical protein
MLDEILPTLPTTLPPGALQRVGLPSDPTLHDELADVLAKVDPGRGRVRLRLSLTDDIAGAFVLAAQRTKSGWDLTELAGVTYSIRDEKLAARVGRQRKYTGLPADLKLYE